MKLRFAAAALVCSTLAACAVPAVPGTPTSAPPNPPRRRWSCAQQERFAAVEDYASRTVGAHGYLGVVFTDRSTGAVWRSGDTGHQGWAASTIKLAMAADLLQRSRVGAIRLSAADRPDLDAMLNFSDEAASDRLWKADGGDAMLARFTGAFGMTGLHFVPGFTKATYGASSSAPPTTWPP